MSDRTTLATWATRRPPEPAATAGRVRWVELDGLHGTLERYGAGWSVTVCRLDRPSGAAAVRDTRAGAEAAVAEVLAIVREREGRRVAGSEHG